MVKFYWRTALNNLKREVYTHYTRVEASGRHVAHCSMCGEDDLNVLELHHIDNDGREDRKRHGSGAKYLRSLKTRGYPPSPRLEVLCSNCHGKVRYIKLTSNSF